MLFSVSSEAELEEEAGKLFDKYEGVQPNDKEMFLEEGEAHQGLSEQIIAFEKECLQDYDHAKHEIDILMPKLEKVLAREDLTLKLYGSFATGLWIKQSNVDLLLIRDEYEPTTSSTEVLKRVVELLRKSGHFKSVSLSSRNVRIPMVRADLADSRHIRALHLTMMDPSNNGKAVANFVTEQKNKYPLLQPVFFAVKYLTANYKLG